MSDKLNLPGLERYQNLKRTDGLCEIEEKEIDVKCLPDKPSYFNLFDDSERESAEEDTIGENNYIESKYLPLNGED